MQKKIAVVTGASGGLGKEFVRLLAQQPDLREIWCIARGAEKLGALVAAYGERARALPLDLSDRAAIKQISALLADERPNVAYLINNAGYAKFCAYNDISVEESLNMIDLNVGATVALGLTCLPYMSEGARILNIASQASFQPLPYMNLYAATKAFVRNYTRALNVELHGRGITATAVCPGWMRTDFYARGEIGAQKGAQRFLHQADPAKVAEKALRDAARGKDISVFGAYVKCAHAVAKLTPQKRMMRYWLKQQKLRK